MPSILSPDKGWREEDFYVWVEGPGKTTSHSRTRGTWAKREAERTGGRLLPPDVCELERKTGLASEPPRGETLPFPPFLLPLFFALFPAVAAEAAGASWLAGRAKGGKAGSMTRASPVKMR